MIATIERHLDAVRSACRRHRVARLELFGSATQPAQFDPAHSDIDFIVAFAHGADLGPWLAEYFDLREELQTVLGRPVDLVMEGAICDPLFASEANRTREVVYAAQGAEAA